MSTASISIADAYRAKTQAQRRQSNQYQQVDAEPHDPQYLSHDERRDTRLHEPEYNCARLPDPLTEEVDGRQLPMKLSEAREHYLGLKYNQMDTDGWDSPLDHTQELYGRVLGGERVLIEQLSDPSVCFLSLRQSPVRYGRGGRQWIEPLRLRSNLNRAWQNVRQTLYRNLRAYQRWEYVLVCSYTRSAATPHYHVLVYVEDPDDDLSVSVARSAVDSYVRANKQAHKQHHEVTRGESDAGIVTHDIPHTWDKVPEESHRHVLQYRDHDPFVPTSSFLRYMMTQYPHWVLNHVWDGASDIHAHDPLVDGATISWASPFDDYSSSQGFPDSPD